MIWKVALPSLNTTDRRNGRRCKAESCLRYYLEHVAFHVLPRSPGTSMRAVCGIHSLRGRVLVGGDTQPCHKQRAITSPARPGHPDFSCVC